MVLDVQTGWTARRHRDRRVGIERRLVSIRHSYSDIRISGMAICSEAAMSPIVGLMLMLRNEIVALRKRHTAAIRPLQLRRFAVSAAPTEGVTIHDERELRDFCCRIFGWDDARKELVNDVTQRLFAAVGCGAAIALRGESDLVPVAHALHRRLLGTERPFVVCDPRRGDVPGSVRSPPNCRSGMDALMAAAGGSICIRACRLPADFDALSEALRGSRPAVQTFVCLTKRDRVRDLLNPPVEIPSLRRRASDLERLIGEYLADATRALGVDKMRFSSIAPDSILRSVDSLTELERTLLRLVALKSTRSLSQAASRLRIAQVSLSRWILRRRPAAVFRDVARLEFECEVDADAKSVRSAARLTF
jgi:hypothetical protein